MVTTPRCREMHLYVLMTNCCPRRGCVCCSSSGELINALVEIANQNAELGPDRRIEHVILETTGDGAFIAWKIQVEAGLNLFFLCTQQVWQILDQFFE